MRELLVISKHWHAPQINVAIHRDKIQLELAVEDFLKALVAEMPHPVQCFTRSALEANMLAALPIVLGRAKESSIHNPPAPPVTPDII